MENFESSFVIRYHYNKNTKNPARVFNAIGELIDAFQVIDKSIIYFVDSKIETEIILEDIEKGSFLVKLKNILEHIPDELINDFDWRKIVGYFLVKAKYAIIKFINERETIDSFSEIETLENDIALLATDAHTGFFNTKNRINSKQLLNGISKISQANEKIEIGEIIEFYFDDEKSELNSSFILLPENIDKLLAFETISNTQEMILKIKKPDYLGDSKWDFRHGAEPINARIDDEVWLLEFRDSKFTLNPGDSLRASVSLEVIYDDDREVVAKKFTVLKVLEIIKPRVFNLPTFFDN